MFYVIRTSPVYPDNPTMFRGAVVGLYLYRSSAIAARDTLNDNPKRITYTVAGEIE